ncbi:hypothetical protein [Zunongwangia sp.]|uniref:hypothetical protein n=1 Tax=Zunongwangia sp. TaxID=1965325 RepID=UPI003AA9A754
MKKYFLTILFAGVLFNFTACRETTEQKTKDAVDAIGDDIEDNVKKAGEKIEKGADKVKEDVNKEIKDTDGVN